MSNNFAFFVYFILYVGCTYACAYLPYTYYDVSLWIAVPVALAISWLPTVILAFIIWPPLSMLLGVLGLDTGDEVDKPKSQGQQYVIDTKTGERIDNKNLESESDT